VKTIVATHNPDLARDFDRDLLRRRDLRLVTARTIPELIDGVRNGADMCFVDRVLPDGDAPLALATLRGERRHAHVPVVLVSSAGAPAAERSAAREAGFADVVELPAAPGVLPLLVARLLGIPLREDERFAVRVHVFSGEAGHDDEDYYLGTTLDLSEAGMLLRSRRTVTAGELLDVRFALPGRAGELTLRARVVRVDEGAAAPAHAIALSFEGVGAVEHTALHEYLRVLVSGRPFSWRIDNQDGRQVVSLSGVLRADSDLGALELLRGAVWFCLREFRRISSDSVQRWIDFIRDLDGVTAIHLVECPISFIHQANLITNLLDRQEVESFFAPYACSACGLEEERLIDVRKDLEGGKRRKPPALACSGCRAPAAFDDLVEQYFAFLDR
jgi:CheY-like chemotaxis protein